MANTTPGWSTGFYSGGPNSGALGNGFYGTPQGSTNVFASPTGPYANPSTTDDYGGSGMSSAQYFAKYGNPTQQGDAASAAGAAAYATGNSAANNPAVNPTLPNTTVPGATPTGVLSGPGYGESEFQQHGNDLLGQPSNSQSLYDEGVSATNPYFQNAITQTNKAIDMAEASRGEGNSGAALGEIGTADATLLGQQALAQEQLAGQADTANTNQYTATMNAANGAENETNSRVNGAAAAYTNLSTQQANLVDNFYSMAEQGQLTGDMASIEAQLAAAGVDAATAQAISNDLLQAAAIGVKATSGGK